MPFAPCAPETLAGDSRCLRNLSDRELLAVWAWLLCNGGPSPPADQGITTDPDGLIITTDDGLVILPD